MSLTLRCTRAACLLASAQVSRPSCVSFEGLARVAARTLGQPWLATAPCRPDAERTSCPSRLCWQCQPRPGTALDCAHEAITVARRPLIASTDWIAQLCTTKHIHMCCESHACLSCTVHAMRTAAHVYDTLCAMCLGCNSQHMRTPPSSACDFPRPAGCRSTLLQTVQCCLRSGCRVLKVGGQRVQAIETP